MTEADALAVRARLWALKIEERKAGMDQKGSVKKKDASKLKLDVWGNEKDEVV